MNSSMFKAKNSPFNVLASLSFFATLVVSPSLTHAETKIPLANSNDPYKEIRLDAEPQPLAQNVTSVSQLSDVKPTDWAFTALQSLVERYGCIAGYPDRTFRGKQATSRYEFAAGLNACLDKINEIISAGLADKVSKADLATLQKLQEEFAAELAILRGRVDALDAKTAKLEAQQFSTTTKLTGEVIFSATAGSGGASNVSSNVTLGNRTRLVLNTSFTGKDLLRTRLEASNNLAAASNTTANSLAGALGTNTARIGPGPATSFIDNSFALSLLDYKFPIFDDKVTLYIAPISFPDEFFTVLSPVASNGQGSISRFGRFDPLMRIAGTSSLVAFDWKVTDRFKIQAGYGSSRPADATLGGQGGLFGGSTIALVQLLFKPADNLDASITYTNTYHQSNTLGTGLVTTATESINASGVTSIRANSIGGNLAWKVTPKITFHTWGTVIFADAVNTSASTTFTSWITGLTFNDLFSEGSAASILFGQPLNRTSVSGSADLGKVNTTPYHLEIFYRYRVSPNISITPGIFWVFNPEGVSTNTTATVGVIRTTFTF
ncbi:iron uptake porin [Pseudanabaena catenata USMAC16]|uniref:Iron uptake porin n=2 Tax=Pseudanabaena TaxID=1152 RepID=A0A9X4MA31_9CYAN|nr:iron uptake porin [Pseudanabaena catenata]MDG3495754.1 iron uptake porin [Pseudanabaena catenata USMAC16]